MCNHLISCIDYNKLLCDYQFGFQKDTFTHLTIMMLVGKITDALEQAGDVVGVIFLDFPKTFDTVDHGILLQKKGKKNMEYVVLTCSDLRTLCVH